MTRLLLLRHAESEWNAEGRWQGIADPPLSTRGERQARDIARLLRPLGFTAVVSSDLHRARRTADLLAPALDLASPEIDTGLREYDVGEWSGLTRHQIEDRWPGAIAAWREGRLAATPNGERRDTSIVRIGDALGRIAAAHPIGPVLVITHGGVIGSLATSLGADPSRIGHLAGHWFTADPAGLTVGDPVALLGVSTAQVLDTPHR